MSNIYLTSDWHLGETRFEIMGRPFTDQQEMIDTLVENHNRVVQPEDTVYMLGDVCFQKTPEFLPQVDRFNGMKHLVRGNHDRVFTDKDLEQYFVSITPEGSGIELDIPLSDETNVKDTNILHAYLTHYPTQGKEEFFNLVGHIHGAWKYQLNMLNVGVDVHNYCPVNTESLLFHFQAICNYYDDDVWVAYKSANASFVNKRGKPGSYYTS
jgi:calcineurin-like phosphoesterase family protein